MDVENDILERLKGYGREPSDTWESDGANKYTVTISVEQVPEVHTRGRQDPKNLPIGRAIAYIRGTNTYVWEGPCYPIPRFNFDVDIIEGRKKPKEKA
jgi:hypothetical protein